MIFRLGTVFSITLSLIAFILSIVVMLSGKDKYFLTNVFVLRVNTANIALTKDVSAVLSRAGLSGSKQVSEYLKSSQTSGDVVNQVARELGLHDTYSAHIFSWCEKTYATGDIATDSECTKPKISFTFDPIKILQDDLLDGTQLSDLGLPTQDIESDVKTLTKVYKAMGILYLIGTILAGISVLTGIASFFGPRAVGFLTYVVVFLGMVALGAASIIATAFAVVVRNVFNQKVKEVVGIEAYNSATFLGLTWAAFGAIFLASLVWCGICCCGSHRRNSDGEKKAVQGYGDEERPRGWSFRRKATP